MTLNTLTLINTRHAVMSDSNEHTIEIEIHKAQADYHETCIDLSSYDDNPEFYPNDCAYRCCHCHTLTNNIDGWHISTLTKQIGKSRGHLGWNEDYCPVCWELLLQYYEDYPDTSNDF